MDGGLMQAMAGGAELNATAPLGEMLSLGGRWPTAERLGIARELHDVVSYTIAAINLQAGVALHVFADSPERVEESLHSIRATSKDALHELRAILGMLLELNEDGESTVSCLRSRLERLAANTTGAGTPTRLHVLGSPWPLSATVSRTAYRVVQESLTNVLRYSGATCAEIVLSYDDAELLVEITDDGVGDAHDLDSQGAGSGIAGMQDRVESCGGRLEIGPRELHGFRVRAWLPA
jgi:signal transduction histidine kinase